MKRLVLSGFVFLTCLSTVLSAQNLIVDGDLEGHTAIGCTYNQPNGQFNALYANITSFGISGGIDIMAGTFCFGLPPQSGATKLGLAWNNVPGGDKDAMALDLTTPLVAGFTYSLSLWAEHLPFGTPQPFLIGVSTSSTQAGTLVYSATPTTAGWGNFTTTFVAPLAGSFLTVRPASGPDTWIAFDNLVLQPSGGGGQITVNLSSPLGPGSLQIDDSGLSGLPAFNVFTLNEPCPGGPGSGPLLGLCSSNLPWILYQINSGIPPFSFVPTGPTFTFGPLTGFQSGLALEVVCFELAGGTINASPVAAHVIP